MRNATTLLCTVFFLMTASSTVALAQRPDPTQSLEHMKKLDFLVGHWQGEGWMEFMPGQRHTFQSKETVERKLGGVALLIEGHHTAEGATIHHALAMLSYNQEGGGYHFRSQVASGQGGNFEGLLVKEGVFRWGMQMQQRTIRYTIMLNDAGQWYEIGEMSQDGTTWRQFFEMTLDRVPPEHAGSE